MEKESIEKSETILPVIAVEWALLFRGIEERAC